LNSNSIKTNGMQIDEECIQNLLLNMVLEKKSLKKHKYKTTFHAFSFGNGLNKFQFGTI
jgi:hypothetical protein